MSKKRNHNLKENKGVFISKKKQREFLNKCHEYVSKIFEEIEIEEAKAQRKHKDFRVRACC